MIKWPLQPPPACRNRASQAPSVSTIVRAGTCSDSVTVPTSSLSPLCSSAHRRSLRFKSAQRPMLSECAGEGRQYQLTRTMLCMHVRALTRRRASADAPGPAAGCPASLCQWKGEPLQGLQGLLAWTPWRGALQGQCAGCLASP